MRILVLFGGESVEHEISIITANQIINALGVNYKVLPLYISKENKLYYHSEFKNLDSFKDIKKYLKKKNEVKICRKNKTYYLSLNGLKKKKCFRRKSRKKKAHSPSIIILVLLSNFLMHVYT